MGNSCTHAADAVAHLVTETEIRDAVRSIEEWQKQQTTAVKAGMPNQNTYGPLLQRVGGPDVVKKVVELFYRKLYGDPRLILFLHDQDVMHLRAKQSAFIAWLFGPPNMPYMGRSVRIAHLRIIKQRGFNGDDFDLGMRYFEQAMAELGAPEAIIGEVMRRLRPFKDAFFTPSPKDAEEEARWVQEEREKEEAAEEEERKRHEQEDQEAAYHERERRLQEQITLAHRVAEAEAEAEAGETAEWAADAAVAAALTAALTAGATSRAVTVPPSREPTCPFTGGRMSRPNSAKVSSPGAPAVAVAAATAVVTESPPVKPATPTAGPTSPKGPAGGAPTPPRSPGGDAIPSIWPASKLATRPGSDATGAPPPPPDNVGPVASLSVSSPSTPPTAAGRPGSAAVATPAAAPPPSGDVGRVASPPISSPSTPPTAPGRPGSAVVATPAPLPSPPNPAATEFEEELDEIERALATDDVRTTGASKQGGGEDVPLLSGSSSSGARRTTAVC